MQALQYVEIDFDSCALTYSVLPCRAQLGYSGFFDGTAPADAQFDGTNDWLRRSAGLVGAADSKRLTISAWIRRADTRTSVPIIAGNSVLGGGAANAGPLLRIGPTGVFQVIANNAAGTQIYNCSSTTVPPVNGWRHVLVSFDLNVPGANHFYVDDVSELAVTTFTNDTVDYTLADWAIAAHPDGTAKYFGDLADLWFAPGVYLDMTVVANRRKFVSADARPVQLGATGQLPTGTAPLVFMANPPATWQINLGTGGAFTELGQITENVPFATGNDRCFNTLKTCQDRANFTQVDKTLRFAVPTDYLPSNIEAIPSIKTISFNSATVSLGQNLGQRASITVTFEDHKHSDTGIDPYFAQRTYDPWAQGTFFGRFRARVPFLRGRALRWINGQVGQALENMETRHYIIDSYSGPNNNGEYEIIAKDILKLADGDRALAPIPNTGFLSANITDVATSATLLPAGIGNAEYPATPPDFYVAIGGNEIVRVTTRAGDVFTIVRAQLGTVATTHNADDRVQLALRYVGMNPADIIEDLLTTYADVSSSYIPLDEWLQETNLYLNRLFTATIAQPTEVDKLISELIEQAGLVLWWRDRFQTIGLSVLRGAVSEALPLTPDNIIENSLDISEQPDKRLSSISTYFGQINPLTELSTTANFRSVAVLTDLQAESDYGSPAIKEIFARWIPANGRTIADRTNSLHLARFKDPPRKFKLKCLRDTTSDLMLAQVYNLTGWPLQSSTGTSSPAPFQITRLAPRADVMELEGEEMLFVAPIEDLTTRNIVIDSNTEDFNARTTHDLLYPPADVGVSIKIIINAGVIVGSSSTATPAFDVGTWPSGINITVTVRGRIEGHGGDGGFGGSGAAGTNGLPGGPALKTRYPISLEVATGAIWGGGGGGGAGVNPFGAGGSGGGGAGKLPGQGGGGFLPGSPGTTEVGGGPGLGPAPGGNGGNPGQAGLNSNTNGGAAGAAIDGVTLGPVTVTTGPGSILGPQIN